MKSQEIGGAISKSEVCKSFRMKFKGLAVKNLDRIFQWQPFVISISVIMGATALITFLAIWIQCNRVSLYYDSLLALLSSKKMAIGDPFLVPLN